MVSALRARQFRWGGMLVEQGQRPVGREVFNEHRQFGEHAGQQAVQLVDQPGVLLGGDFQQGYSIAELLELRRVMRRAAGSLDNGEPGAGHALGGIGLAFVEMDLAVRFVASRLPDRDRGLQVELMQPLQKVLGILTSRINADVQVHVGVFARELVKGVLELLIPCGGLGEVEGIGSGPFLFIEKGNMMGIASGINPDSDMHGLWRRLVVHDLSPMGGRKKQSVVMSVLPGSLTGNARDKASGCQDVTTAHVKVRREQSRASGQATASSQRSSRTTDNPGVNPKRSSVSTYERPSVLLSRIDQPEP